jgi:hypothetical protein
VPGLVRGPHRCVRGGEGLDIPDKGTTLVCAPIADEPGLGRALKAARIRASVRGGSLRLSPHLHNTSREIEDAIEVVAPFVAR